MSREVLSIDTEEDMLDVNSFSIIMNSALIRRHVF